MYARECSAPLMPSDSQTISATPSAEMIRLENGGVVDPTGLLRNPPPRHS